MLVDDGVDLDDFETEQPAVVGQDLHGQVSFTVSGAAADGGPDSGSVFGRTSVGPTRWV